VRILAWRSFEGPNVHCHRPVLEFLLDLEALDGVATCDVPGAAERLVAMLPPLAEHHCGLGRPGGFAQRLREGTLFGHVVEHVALELIHRAGEEVRYGKTRATRTPGVYSVAVEQRTPEVARAAAEAALDLVERIARGHEVDLATAEGRVAQAAAAHALGPSTRALWDAAQRRGIPVRRMGTGSFLALGYGRHMRRVEGTITDATSAVAVDAAQDKALTRSLLEAAGLPVAEGMVAGDAEAAAQALARLGPPLVVKPRRGRQGEGVSLDVRTPEEARRAFALAAAADGEAVCERQLAGSAVRVLVVGGRAVAAAVRRPAQVVGDGRRTVAELVAAENARPERGEGHARPLTRIRLDSPQARAALARVGHAPDSVPAAGERVPLCLAANLSTGGTAEDVTDGLHPDNARLAVRAAQAVGLDVAGVDLILVDPGRSYRETGGAVLEVNASPGLRMHLFPSVGRPRPVADAIVDHLFGAGDGRIPVVAITGTNGKTTVARLVAHMVGETGRTVGLTTTDGIRVGAEELAHGDDAGPRSAQSVLSDPRVEVAVLECARGGIRRRGLGFDRCQVGAVLNVASDHLGQDGVDSLDELAHVKSLVVECVLPEGAAVLNAHDPRVRAMAARTPARVVLFSGREGDPYVRRHVERGGEAVAVAAGRLVHLWAGREEEILPLRRLAFAFAGASTAMVENACAAAAIGFGLGLGGADVARGLRTFSGGPRDNPGRMNLMAVGDARVLLDYGHNAPAIAAAASLARRLATGRLLAVVGVPGDRRDRDIAAAGEVAARVFDRVWFKEDRDRRGRAAGEVAALLEAGALRAGAPRRSVQVCLAEEAALARALEEAAPGDLVVYFYESYEPARAALAELGREAPHRLATVATAAQGPGG
jgi:cyanophycin synthetase